MLISRSSSRRAGSNVYVEKWRGIAGVIAVCSLIIVMLSVSLGRREGVAHPASGRVVTAADDMAAAPGHVWLLAQVVRGGMVIDLATVYRLDAGPDGVWLNLLPDGQFSASDSVNIFGGRYVLADGRMHLDSQVQTLVGARAGVAWRDVVQAGLQALLAQQSRIEIDPADDRLLVQVADFVLRFANGGPALPAVLERVPEVDSHAVLRSPGDAVLAACRAVSLVRSTLPAATPIRAGVQLRIGYRSEDSANSPVRVAKVSSVVAGGQLGFAVSSCG